MRKSEQCLRIMMSTSGIGITMHEQASCVIRGAVARPDRGGPRDYRNSPGGRQYKIIIGSARPNRSYTQHISRRPRIDSQTTANFTSRVRADRPQTLLTGSPPAQTSAHIARTGSRHHSNKNADNKRATHRPSHDTNVCKNTCAKDGKRTQRRRK